VLGLQGVAWGAGACLIPGLLLILISSRVTGRDRSLKLLLYGTALRMGFVLLTAFVAVNVQPALQVNAFYLSLALFYVVALFVETRVLVAEVAPGQSSELARAALTPTESPTH